jgi:hypothetical protein
VEIDTVGSVTEIMRLAKRCCGGVPEGSRRF